MKGAGGGGGKDCVSDIVDGMEYMETFGDGRPRAPGLAGPGEDGVGDSPGTFGVSAFLNKLDIPDTMMPGCMPNKGESRFTAPRMRCLK